MILFFSISTYMAAILGYLSQRNNAFAIFSIVISFLGFFILSVTVDANVAQDRLQYFEWYKVARTAIFTDDIIFNLFLSILPSGLSEIGLSFIFTMVISILLARIIFAIKRIFRLSYEFIALITIFIITDRIFIDLSLNTVRSTICILLMLNIFFNKSLISKLALIFLAFGIHQIAASVFIIIGSVLMAISFSPRLISCVALLGIFVFVLKIFSYQVGFNDYAQLLAFEMIQSQERMARSTEIVELTLSASFAIQVALSILFPMLIYIMETFRPYKNTKLSTHKSTYDVKSHLMPFSIAVGGMVLAIYPEFILSLRFILIPIVCSVILLPLNTLRALVFVKVVMLSYAFV